MRGGTVLAILVGVLLACWIATHFCTAEYTMNFRERRAEFAVGNGEFYLNWYPVPETWFDVWGGVFTYGDSPPTIRKTLFGYDPYPTAYLKPAPSSSMGWFPTYGGASVPFWNLALIGGVAWLIFRMRRGGTGHGWGRRLWLACQPRQRGIGSGDVGTIDANGEERPYAF